MILLNGAAGLRGHVVHFWSDLLCCCVQKAADWFLIFEFTPNTVTASRLCSLTNTDSWWINVSILIYFIVFPNPSMSSALPPFHHLQPNNPLRYRSSTDSGCVSIPDMIHSTSDARAFSSLGLSSGIASLNASASHLLSSPLIYFLFPFLRVSPFAPSDFCPFNCHLFGAEEDERRLNRGL